MIYEITIPGSWLNTGDEEFQYNTRILLLQLESNFFDANISLNLFNSSRNQPREITTAEEEWNIAVIDGDRRSAALEAHGYPTDQNAILEIISTSDIENKREHWNNGNAPARFKVNTLLIYARAFLYALHGFNKILKVIVELEGAPESTKQNLAAMNSSFPDLKSIRDTAQHIEDRIRKLDRKNRKIVPKPITNNNYICSPNGGIFALTSLHDTKLVTTLPDGRLGEVDISHTSMKVLQDIYQNTLNSLSWRGPKRHIPSK